MPTMLRGLASLGLLAAYAAEADLRCMESAPGVCAADEASLIQVKQVQGLNKQLLADGKVVDGAFHDGYTSQGWTTELAMNCYPGNGADSLLGGPYGDTPAVGGVSAVAICQSVCDSTAGCEGIVMCTAADGKCGRPNFKKDSTCWLIKNVVTSKCAKSYPGYSTWLSPRVTNLATQLVESGIADPSPFARLPEGWCPRMSEPSDAQKPETCKRDYLADQQNFRWLCARRSRRAGGGIRRDLYTSSCTVHEFAYDDQFK